MAIMVAMAIQFKFIEINQKAFIGLRFLSDRKLVNSIWNLQFLTYFILYDYLSR